MSIFQKQLARKTKIQIALISAAILCVITLLILDIVFGGPLTRLLTDKDQVVAAVKSWGFFGPLLFILIQAVQTVVAPIPGNVSGAVGGFLFGWWGILWSTIGSFFGFWVVFLLARKFGRNLVEKIIKKEALSKFDGLAKEKGSAIFFLIFLIPGLPDDVVGYIAGLTTIPIRKLLVLAVIGRTPSVIATNMFGAGLGEDNIIPVVVIAVISTLICLVVAAKRDVIVKYLNKPAPKKK